MAGVDEVNDSQTQKGENEREKRDRSDSNEVDDTERKLFLSLVETIVYLNVLWCNLIVTSIGQDNHYEI